MSKIDVSAKSLGINFKNSKASVLVWAPNAQKVEFHTPETNMREELKHIEHGYWQGLVLLQPGDKYNFILDGKPIPDPASLSQPDGVHGPSQAIDIISYKWTDNQWANLPLESYIIYELHTGTFTPDGNFAAIETKLDYLLQCGFTAIELMPVAQFPGSRNWGYDGVFPFAVQNTYGGARALQHLVDACHKKGMAVILDVVYNHLGPEGNYLDAYGPYFTDKYKTPWGKAVNFDDAWCDEVRRYLIENMLMWFRDFHIDALRLDAVHAIWDFSPKHIMQEMKEYTNELMSLTGKTHYLIIESDLNDSKYIRPLSQKGYGIDAQWADDFHHSLCVVAGYERNGYYADFNGLKDLAKAYKEAFVYNGIYSQFRHKTFGSTVDKNEGKQFVVFSQNHDQVGNRLLGERNSTLLSFEMQKLMAGAVAISPYLPLFFMGEEWSAPQPFQYFISHIDEKLIEAVRKGRKEEFASFHNTGEAPDPQAVETFNNCKLQWELLQQQPHYTMLDYYSALLALRKQNPALNNLNRKHLDAKTIAKQNILILRRWDVRQSIVCMLNFSKVQQEVPFPTLPGSFLKIFDSALPQWGGKSEAEAAGKTASGEKLAIQPESLLIYSTQNV